MAYSVITAYILFITTLLPASYLSPVITTCSFHTITTFS